MAYTKAKISIPNVTGDIVITATAVPSVPSYTNLFIPGDAQVNKRFSSNGNISGSAANGSVVVGNYIDVSSIDKAKTTYMYIKGAKAVDADGTGKFTYSITYDDNKTVGSVSQYNTATSSHALYADFEYQSLGDNYGRFKLSNIKGWSTAKYIRINLFVNTTSTAISASDIANMIITIDEPIQ